MVSAFWTRETTACTPMTGVECVRVGVPVVSMVRVVLGEEGGGDVIICVVLRCDGFICRRLAFFAYATGIAHDTDHERCEC